MPDPLTPPEIEQMTAAVRRWVETFVVELNLCPFAKKELLANKVRFYVTPADNEEALLLALQAELDRLDQEPEIETTVLILPHLLHDFLDYNQFLDLADALIDQMGLDGVYQIASFHPDYQYAGTQPADAENYINRSPYPLLHILREDSVGKAIASYPDVAQIPVRNIALMNEMGIEKLELRRAKARDNT